MKFFCNIRIHTSRYCTKVNRLPKMHRRTNVQLVVLLDRFLLGSLSVLDFSSYALRNAAAEQSTDKNNPDANKYYANKIVPRR